MSRNFKTRDATGPTPEEALRLASQVAPTAPPAVLAAPAFPAAPAAPPAPPPEPMGVLSQRFTETTLLAIARAAKQRGTTQKRLIAEALRAAGVPVAPADLADRAPPRRRGDEV